MISELPFSNSNPLFCTFPRHPFDFVGELAMEPSTSSYKANAIISKLQTTTNQQRGDEPTVLIAADTVCCVSPKAILQRLLVDDYLKDAVPIVKVCLWLTFIVKCDLEVAVYEGVIREKPTSKEEARQFLKDYSGKLAATVGSVLVTNLKTGLRKGDLDRVDVLFSPTFAILKKREHYGAEELHSFGFVGGLSVRIPTHPADVH
ncbi:hypothetical protein GmHk_14G040341 [Glycine max]|nr:hypothetical protein GmHk_14G040341 [Glycine max]